MQTFTWTPEHSAALAEFLAAGFSFARVANALNAKFGTAFTRNAVLGRAKRMKLVVFSQPRHELGIRRLLRHDPRMSRAGGRRSAMSSSRIVKRIAPPKLRRADVRPRLIPLLDLKTDECRYPYGGDRDGEAITFCGHRCRAGSVYCEPHFRLTRGPVIDFESSAIALILQLAELA